MTRNQKTRGFTLIELLVVIAIIALLVGIVLPSFNAARNAAKSATSKAFLVALDSAIRNYKINEYLGSYPPSYWDTSANGNPYNADATPLISSDFNAMGAQTLVWAMAGADFRGTPGFAGNLQTLYALDTDTPPSPVRRRIPAFIDVNKDNVMSLNDAGLTHPDGVDPGKAPVFVDTFGNPVLYYKWQRPASGNLGYDWTHNDLSKGTAPIIEDQAALNNYVQDRGNFAQGARAQNYGDFVLITAGADGKLGVVDGTGKPDDARKDDITNFD